MFPVRTVCSSEGKAKRVQKWQRVISIIVGIFLTSGLLFVAAPVNAEGSVAGSQAGTTAMAVGGQLSSQVLPLAGTSDARTVCGSVDIKGGDYLTAAPLLPVDRWKDATASLHSRLGSNVWDDLQEKSQRYGVVTGLMVYGNALWSASSSLAAFSSQYCLLDKLGGAADKLAGSIGGAFLGGPQGGVLAAMVILFSIGGILWQSFRGSGTGGAAKRILGKVAVLAVIATMVMGATASTGDGTGKGSGPFNPGLGSPGWYAIKINSTISALSSTSTAALDGLTSSATSGSANRSQDQTSCAIFTENMKKAYKQTYGSATDQLGASVPLLLSSLWEETGLATWKTAQFGTYPSGEYADIIDRSYCPLLEYNASTPVTLSVQSTGNTDNDANEAAKITSGTRRALMVGSRDQKTPGLAGLVPKAEYWSTNAFFPQGGNQGVDRSIVAAAACIANGTDLTKPEGWSVAWPFTGGWVDESKAITPKNCALWFTDPNKGMPNQFDWPDNKDDVLKWTTLSDGSPNGEARNFMLNLHGNDNTAGMATGFGYAMSSTSMSLVFGAVSLAVIAAKTLVVIMVATIILMLIMLLFPRARASKVAEAVKVFIGLTLFSFFAFMIFGIIGILTLWMTGVGNAMFGTGSFGAVIWAGLAPLVAVVSIHFLFKRVLKLPSPFSLKGALAWGAMAGGTGAAAMAGAKMGSGRSRTGQVLKKATSAGANGLKRRLGPPEKRFGGMTPKRAAPYKTDPTQPEKETQGEAEIETETKPEEGATDTEFSKEDLAAAQKFDRTRRKADRTAQREKRAKMSDEELEAASLDAGRKRLTAISAGISRARQSTPNILKSGAKGLGKAAIVTGLGFAATAAAPIGIAAAPALAGYAAYKTGQAVKSLKNSPRRVTRNAELVENWRRQITKPENTNPSADDMTADGDTSEKTKPSGNPITPDVEEPSIQPSVDETSE